MPSYQADKSGEYQRADAAQQFGLTANDRACIMQLVGHALAVVEREFILQTLRRQGGNRTRSADVLRISIRSLRDRIRCYRRQGENVPEPESISSGCRNARPLPDVRH
jgi:DNA-binding NtrC family response regulator